MSAAGYEEGGAGAGGKFRKRPFRRAQRTPYDRPATSLRPSQAAAEKNGWLSKLVDPASKLLTYGAHKLFSSVFRKRLLPPPHPPKDDLDGNAETRDVQPHGTTAVSPTTDVVHSDTKEPATTGENDASKIADASGVAELEAMLKQKRFTRSEIEHLTTLLLSRTVDNSVGAERVRSESKTPDLQAFDGRHESLSIRPVQENGIDRAVTGAISTPAIRAKVHEEDVASPAELAKAYMGSRSAKVSSTGLGLQSQRPREEPPSLYKPPFNLKSPATSLLQKPMNDIGTSENGFVTPRFRGRSAIYSMARTPYSRMHPTDAFKASETVADSHGRSPLSIIENKQFNESQKQALKRRSSVLENDIGSVGPIRRIRQKPNLLHPKTLTLPASGGPRAAHGSGPLLDVTELPPSSNWSSHSHSLLKSMATNNKPSTSSGYVPSQSIETAQKIFQQLDKFSPKGKSSDLKIDIAGGNSPSRMTPALSGGLAHHSTETLDSLKILQRIQDNKKENGRMDSVDAHFPLLRAPKTVEEASVKKFVLTTDNLACQDGAEARVPASFSSHDTKITVSHSGFDPSQKKRAFQMSAHEDYLELDDDVHLNGVASTPLGEGAGSTELLKKSVVIPDGVPPREAIAVEKPVVPEPKSEDSLLGKRESESLVDGSVTTNKSIGFTFPVAPSTSLSNSTGTAPITVSKSAANSEKAAPEFEKKLSVPAFSAKSDKLSEFAFSTSSSAVESAVQDTRPELPNSVDIAAVKADGPVETDGPSSQEPVDGFKKPEGGPSPVISSAKGIFGFGSTANNATPTNALCGPIPTSVTSSPGLFSSISGNQSAVAVNPLSSPTLLSGSSGLSNGFAASTSATGTATAGTMVGTTTASSMPTFLASTSQISSSATVASVSCGPSFQFGSSTSAIFSTPPSSSAENSAPKLVETSTNTSSSIFSSKPPEIASGGTVISGFDASSFKAANSEAQPAAAAPSTESVFGFQVTAAASPVSTSAPSFLSQSTSSASVPAFGLSGATNFGSGASVFGSVSPAASPFSSVLSSSGVSSMSSSVSSGSGTTSSIFSSSWQPSKSTFPTSTFGATSTSTGFSFGAAASRSSSDGNKPSVLFGSATSNSSSSNSASFVFGSATPKSSSSSSASSTPFVFGTAPSSSSGSSSTSGSAFVFGSSSSSSAAPVFSFSSSISTTTSGAPSASPPSSQPVFVNNASTPTFGFGSTAATLGNNDQMSMEDSMAEDSMQAPAATPGSVFGQSPIAATPSGGFVFGAAPSPSPSPAPAAAPGFMGAPSGNPFQFGSQPNQMPPQNPSAFQPSGSVEFHAGSTGSFSLGSGGGDKANRRIVKVKSKMRRK